MKPSSFLLLFCLPWYASSMTAASEAVIAENDQVRFVFPKNRFRNCSSLSTSRRE